MNDIEKRAQEVLAGLGPVHGKLLTEGYEGSADAVTDAGEVIRELLAHYTATQAAPADTVDLWSPIEQEGGAGLMEHSTDYHRTLGNTEYFVRFSDYEALRVARLASVSSDDVRAAWISGRDAAFAYTRKCKSAMAADPESLTYDAGPYPEPPADLAASPSSDVLQAVLNLLLDNHRLREALSAMLGRHTLYCGGEDLPFAGHSDVKLFEIARAALVPASSPRDALEVALNVLMNTPLEPSLAAHVKLVVEAIRASHAEMPAHNN